MGKNIIDDRELLEELVAARLLSSNALMPYWRVVFSPWPNYMDNLQHILTTTDNDIGLWARAQVDIESQIHDEQQSLGMKI